jgi:hypothetical protein
MENGSLISRVIAMKQRRLRLWIAALILCIANLATCGSIHAHSRTAERAVAFQAANPAGLGDEGLFAPEDCPMCNLLVGCTALAVHLASVHLNEERPVEKLRAPETGAIRLQQDWPTAASRAPPSRSV